MVAGDGLTFNALRRANVARLPLFKNKHGEPDEHYPDNKCHCGKRAARDCVTASCLWPQRGEI